MKGASYKKVLIPVLSVVLGLLVGAIIMAVFGFDPVKGYSALLKGSLGKPFYIGETLRQATPLILVGLGFAFASYAGFFNIGVAGQALMGWFASVTTGLLFPDLPKMVLLPLCILVGMLAGALWAGIAGYLKAYFNTSEVIVTIMLNYTALHIVNYVIREVLTEKAEITASVPEAASLKMPFLYQLTSKSTLHGGIFIAIAAVFVVWLLMNKTTTGFELKTVGLNKHAAEYSGMSAKKTIILAMLISGGLAGLGGVMEGLGTFQHAFASESLPSIGWDGMAVALLGLSNPFGILFSSLVFAILRIGGISMPLLAKIPTEVVSIVVAFIIFFVGANYLMQVIVDKFPSFGKRKG